MHRFRKKRTYGFRAQDDFTEGNFRFATSTCIADFVKRTVADGTNLHGSGEDEEHDEEEHEHEGETANTVLLPHVWHDGELILRDEHEDSSDDSASKEDDGEADGGGDNEV